MLVLWFNNVINWIHTFNNTMYIQMYIEWVHLVLDVSVEIELKSGVGN